MKLIRYQVDGRHVLGLWERDMVANLTELDPDIFGSFTMLSTYSHRNGKTIEQTIVETMENSAKEPNRENMALEDDRLLIPLDPAEVWACGITYLMKEEAREHKTDSKDILHLVYNAERPEIFFKTTGIRCVGPNQLIGVRGDSRRSVPEPELAFVLGPDCRVVGFTGGNDVSARDLLEVNPLYLSQAKIFEGCCALGPSIVTVDEVGPEPKLRIDCEITRDGEVVFKGFTNTSRMKRSIEELRSYLCLYNPIPAGTVCLTGTGIVFPDDFALQHGDMVKISIEKIGTLLNQVKHLNV